MQVYISVISLATNRTKKLFSQAAAKLEENESPNAAAAASIIGLRLHCAAGRSPTGVAKGPRYNQLIW